MFINSSKGILSFVNRPQAAYIERLLFHFMKGFAITSSLFMFGRIWFTSMIVSQFKEDFVIRQSIENCSIFLLLLRRLKDWSYISWTGLLSHASLFMFGRLWLTSMIVSQLKNCFFFLRFFGRLWFMLQWLLLVNWKTVFFFCVCLAGFDLIQWLLVIWKTGCFLYVWQALIFASMVESLVFHLMKSFAVTCKLLLSLFVRLWFSWTTFIYLVWNWPDFKLTLMNCYEI